MHLLIVLFLLVRAQANEEYSSADLAKAVDVYPEPFESVPFGNVAKEGFEEPYANQHTDPELDLANAPHTPHGNSGPMLRRGDPRDDYIYNRMPEKDSKVPMWLDIPKLQEMNLNTHSYRLKNKGTKPPVARPNPEYVSFNKQRMKEQYFRKNLFDLTEDVNQDNNFNWTTCDEFGKGASFHPQDIVNIDWIPFYMWSSRGSRSNVRHRFSIPTVKLVEEYKQKYSPYLEEKIDWNVPKLLMSFIHDILLLSVDNTGLFVGVQEQDLPDVLRKNYIKMPLFKIRLKIEDPYLVLMYCIPNELNIILMAVDGQEPPTDHDKKAEAETIGIKGQEWGACVTRDRERERAIPSNRKTRNKGRPKYLSIHRDYGMFPPKDVLEKYNAAFAKKPVPEEP